MLGDKCLHPDYHLRPSHKCRSCKKIIHVLCAAQGSQHEMGQEICPLCESKGKERSNDNQSWDAKMSPAEQEDTPKMGVDVEPDDS